MSDGVQNFPNVPDNIYEWRNTFDYAVWTPDTEVTLCRVPWDSSYRDVVQFDSLGARDDYLLSHADHTVTLNGYVYLRFGEPVRINVPFSQCSQCNYLYVRNRIQPIPSPMDTTSRIPDTFCYFVTQVNYVAPNTTELVVQLDVWQTYGHRMQLGWSYLCKGHAGISNPFSTISNPQEYLLEPEGLNMGDEYDVVYQQFLSFQKDESALLENPHAYWIIVMCSANVIASTQGNVNNPNLTSSGGGVVQNIPEGSDVWCMTTDNYRNFCRRLQDYPWVSQCIQYVTAIPYDFIKPADDSYLPAELFNDVKAWSMGAMVATEFFKNGFNFPDFRGHVLPYLNRMGGYDKLYKFTTSPYCIMELTTYTGGTIIMKPECIESPNLSLKNYLCFAPPSLRITITPDNYNGTGEIPIGYADTIALGNGSWHEDRVDTMLYGGENLDMALNIESFPQFSITNNQYINYLASYKNRLNYSYSAADWARERAFLQAETSRSAVNLENEYEMAKRQNQHDYLLANQLVDYNMAQMSKENTLSEAATSADNAHAAALAGMFSNTLSNVGSGNILGTVGGLMTGGTSYNNASNTLATSRKVAANTFNTTTEQQLQSMTNNWNLLNSNVNAGITYRNALGDMNLGLARQVASGDYDMAIQQIQATVQDAKMLQPTVSGQQGGEYFNMANGILGVMLKIKMPKPHFVRQIGDFWLRFGYYINRWVNPPSDLRIMSKFSFWKFTYASVQGDMPYMFSQTLRGILEAGTTVWSNPDDMYVTALNDNEPASDWGF